MLLLCTFIAKVPLLAAETILADDWKQLSRIQAVSLEADWSGRFFGRSIYFYESSRRETSPEQAFHVLMATELEPSKEDRPNFGMSTKAHFGLFALDNPGSSELPIVIENNFGLMDHFILYRVTPVAIEELLHSGDRWGFSARSYKVRTINHEIILPPGRSYFMTKTWGDSSIQMPLRLWKPRDFSENNTSEYMLLGILLGFQIVMMFYNLFLFIWIKQRVYLYYICLVAANLIFHISNFGLGQQMGYQVLGIETYLNTIQILSVDFIVILGLVFSYSYLEIDYRRYRWLEYAIKASIGISMANILISHWISDVLASYMILVNSMIAINLFILSGFIALRAGFKPAKSYLVAWAFYLVGSSEVILVFLGFAEATRWNYWAQLVGGSAEVALFSVALGVRLKFIQARQSAAIKQLNGELSSMNQALELRVEERTRDIRTILANIKQGIFTVKQDFTIDPEYSPYLESLIQQRNLAGKPVTQILDRCQLNQDRLDQTLACFRASLGDSMLSFDVNEGNLPRQSTIKDQDGNLKHVEMDWVAIEHQDTVDKILVVIRDVTESKRLLENLARKDRELQYVSELIEIKPDRFNRFITVAIEIIRENRTLLEGAELLEDETSRRMLINYHTLKGMTRTIGFQELSHLVHIAEQSLVDRRKLEAGGDISLIEAQLEDVDRLVQTYLRINKDRLGRTVDNDKVLLPRETIFGLVQGIEQLGLANDPAIAGRLLTLRSIYYRSIEDIVYDHIAAIKTMSRELDKIFPRIIFEGLSFGMNPKVAEVIDAAFVHIIRNALDHGLESSKERLERGKPERGSITIQLEQRPRRLEITISDDGRGLQLERIEARAREIGINTDLLSDTDRFDLIFNSGFTTKDEVTSISGRGVGMDAVRSLLKKIDGTIAILPREAIGRFVPFAFCISLPADSCVELNIEYQARALAV